MKPNWLPVIKTKASVLFQWYVFIGHQKKYYQSSLGLDFGMQNQKIINDEIFIDTNEFTALEKLLDRQIVNNKNYLRKFINLCYKHADNLLTVSSDIERLNNIAANSSAGLLSIFRSYSGKVLAFAPFLNTVLVLDTIVKKLLITELKAKQIIGTENAQDELLSQLLIPKKDSFYVDEINDLFKLAIRKEKTGDLSKEEINSFLQKHAWSSVVAYYGNFQTEADIRQRVNDFIRTDIKSGLKKAREVKLETRKKFKESFLKIKNYSELEELVDIARELLYLQTYRLDLFFYVYYKVQPLFKEISQRLNLSIQELVYLTGDEIYLALTHKLTVSQTEIRKRMKNYSLVMENGQLSLSSGIISQTTFASQGITEIHGTIAYKGRARGKVVQVHSVADNQKVKEGDIIVSVNTIPAFVPAMRRAGGIITDVGGMLSHAAIISREFGIPCIVGTQKATKVFQDGDIAELNAYEGTARKIK